MESAGHALGPQGNFHGQIVLLTRSCKMDQLVRATSEYLAGWPADRIRNLQKMDGGWGPFDEEGRASRIAGAADIIRIADSLSHHCRALREAGMNPNPELLELGLYFSLARPIADAFLAVAPRAPSFRNSDQGQQTGRNAATA